MWQLKSLLLMLRDALIILVLSVIGLVVYLAWGAQQLPTKNAPPTARNKMNF